MNESGGGAAIASYVEYLGTLNRFEKEQSVEVQRLELLKNSELSKIAQLAIDLKAVAAERNGTIEEARTRLAAAGIPAEFAATQPPDFNLEATPVQTIEILNPITESVGRHASELPRLHTRHRGMQRDMVILPVFGVGLLFCLFLVVASPALGVVYALLGGGLASQMVRVFGGGWTFRRLGGQDFTPRRPGQTPGTGALAAFLVFDGLIALLWGLLSLPNGFLPGLVVGGALLFMPVRRVRDVLSIDQQAPR